MGGHGTNASAGIPQRALLPIRTTAALPPPSRQATDMRGGGRPPSAPRVPGRPPTAAAAAPRPASATGARVNNGETGAAGANSSKPARGMPAPLPYHQQLRGLLEGGLTPRAGQGRENVQPLPQGQPHQQLRSAPQRQSSQGHGQPLRQRVPPQDVAFAGAVAVPEVPAVQGQAVELRRQPSQQGRPASAGPSAGDGRAAARQPEPQFLDDGDPHQEEYWEWLFKSPPTPASPYGSDVLRALIASISPKFAVKKPDGYVPVTPSSISSSRYVRSDVWGWSCPDSPSGAAGAGGAADAASGAVGSSSASSAGHYDSDASSGYVPLHSPQVRRGSVSPEPLHKKLMRAAAAAAGLLGSRSPTRVSSGGGAAPEQSHAGDRARSRSCGGAPPELYYALHAGGRSRASSYGGATSEPGSAAQAGGRSRDCSGGGAPLDRRYSSQAGGRSRECSGGGADPQQYRSPPAGGRSRASSYGGAPSEYYSASSAGGRSRECSGGGGASPGQQDAPHADGRSRTSSCGGVPMDQHCSPHSGGRSRASSGGGAPLDLNRGIHHYHNDLYHIQHDQPRLQQQQLLEQERSNLPAARHDPHTSPGLPGDAPGVAQSHQAPAAQQSHEVQRTSPQALPLTTPGKSRFFRQQQQEEAKQRQPQGALPALVIGGDSVHSVSPLPAFGVCRQRASGSGSGEGPGRSPRCSSNGEGDSSARTPRWVSPGPGGLPSNGARPRPRGRVTFASPYADRSPPLHPLSAWKPVLGFVARSSIAAPGGDAAHTPVASTATQQALPPVGTTPPSVVRRSPPPKCPLTWEPPPLKVKPRVDPRFRRRAARSQQRQPDFGSLRSSTSGTPSNATTPRASSATVRSDDSTAAAAPPFRDGLAVARSSVRHVEPMPGQASCIGSGSGHSSPRATGAQCAQQAGHAQPAPSGRRAQARSDAWASPPQPQPTGALAACAMDTACAPADRVHRGSASRPSSAAGGAKDTITLHSHAHPAVPSVTASSAAAKAPALLTATFEPAEASAVCGAVAAASSGARARRHTDSGRAWTPASNTTGSSVFSFHMGQAGEAARTAAGVRAGTPALDRPPPPTAAFAAAALSAGRPVPAPAREPHAAGAAVAGYRPPRRRWSLPTTDVATCPNPPEPLPVALFPVPEAAQADGAQWASARVTTSPAVQAVGGRGRYRTGGRPGSGRGGAERDHHARLAVCDAAVGAVSSSTDFTPREAGHGSSSDCGAGLSSGGAGGATLTSSGESWGSNAARERTLYRPLYRPGAEASKKEHEWPATGGRRCGVREQGSVGDSAASLSSRQGKLSPAVPDAVRAPVQTGLQARRDAAKQGDGAGRAAAALPTPAADSGRVARDTAAPELSAPAVATESVRRNLLASFGHASGPSVFAAVGLGSEPSSVRATPRQELDRPSSLPHSHAAAPGFAPALAGAQPSRRRWQLPGADAAVAAACADVLPAHDQGRPPRDGGAGWAPQPPAAPREGAAPRRRGSSASSDVEAGTAGPKDPDVQHKSDTPGRRPRANAKGNADDDIGKPIQTSQVGQGPSPQLRPDPQQRRAPRSILDSPDLGPPKARAPAPAAGGASAGSPRYLTASKPGSRPQSAASCGSAGGDRDGSARRHWSYNRNRERALLINGVLAAAGAAIDT